ncbi:hypothetical protein LINGRAHAP2_LOCUS35094 [Linum grandiflorum]
MWQVVEYENLLSFCRECGRFGHDLESCDRRLPNTVSGQPHPSPTATLVGRLALNTSPVEPDGPSQIVERRHRGSKKESSNHSNGSAKLKEISKGKTISLTSNGSIKTDCENKGDAVDNFDSRPKIVKSRQAPMSKPTVESSGSGLSWKAKCVVPTGGSIAQRSKVNKVGPGGRPIVPKPA